MAVGRELAGQYGFGLVAQEGSVVNKIKNILVAVDLNDGSEEVAGVAAGLAEACSAKLYFLHVERDFPKIIGDPDVPGERDVVANDIRASHRELQDFRDKMTPPGVEAAALQVHGRTVEKILSEANALRIDLMVLGFHHGLLHHLLEQDVIKHVLNHAPCPVVVVPPPEG
jgi:nucleotide-binding universal stress UspA family protein